MSDWLCIENGTRPETPCCTACVPTDMDPQGTMAEAWAREARKGGAFWDDLDRDMQDPEFRHHFLAQSAAIDGPAPRLLDLFCCQGGASAGYVAAGFEVVGVDLEPQPRYPYEFAQGDALDYLFRHGHEFDAIHASPPCQAHTLAQRLRGNEHPDLIAPTRELLSALDVPWVIENVPGSPLHDPIELCGAMFGLETYRHRLFESNVPLVAPEHPAHVAKTTKMGRAPKPDEFMHIVGNFSGVDRGRQIMGMDWANRDGLREAIPPAYTQHLGHQMMAHIEGQAAA